MALFDDSEKQEETGIHIYDGIDLVIEGTFDTATNTGEATKISEIYTP